MPETTYIEWDGKSGEEYRYRIYQIGFKFSKNPGNYIFAKEVKPGEWSPVYIGQTGDMSKNFTEHPRMPCILKRGLRQLSEKRRIYSLTQPASQDPPYRHPSKRHSR